MEFSDDRSRAEALKEEGNKLLGEKKYARAAEKYSAAIDIAPSPIYYSNRAMAMIKIENYGLAVADANAAIALDVGYVKAYYRRGSAHFALQQYKEARKDFRLVLKIVPNDADAKKKLAACEKYIKEEMFLRAIETEDAAPTSATVNINDIVVESSYDGPHLTVDEVTGQVVVTVEFVQQMIQRFKNQKLVHRKYVLQMLVAARKHFLAQRSLVRVSLPDLDDDKKGHFTVCGDTHGQFYDLCNIFEIGGFPSATNPYLFNGDYVDRGSFSFEVVMTLLALKLALPTGLYMTRGNHETRGMNKIYGFEGEVLHKYDTTVMNVFTEVFNVLPLAVVIEDTVFVVHGGLSTEKEGAVTLDEIAAIPRNCQPPEKGLMSDLLWADPQPQTGRSPSKRGVGFSFGPDITQRFLDTNNLKLVVRSHEVKDEGYEVEHGGKCITIFSAPNYCDQMGNKGAFIRFSADNGMQPVFTQFTAVPHPNIPPMHFASPMMGQFGL